MAKEFVWNIVVEEVPYIIKLTGNKLSVNNNEPMKYTKLNKAVGEGKGANYEVPIGNKTAILRISTYSSPVLTLDGRDCSTGETYEEPKLPGWAWIFVILHALSFVLLLGGAVGGAIQGCMIVVIMNVAMQKNKSIGLRVGICSAVLVISYIAQYLLAYFLVTTFGL